MKWTQATGLLAAFGLIAAGGVWAGCSNGGGGDDGGTDSGGSDVQQQKDTGGGDAANDTGPGDGGAGVDASVLDCTYYCDNIATACTGNNNQYKDKATCMSMCQNGFATDASAGTASGNSVACHMYHLSVAATGGTNADLHCPHAGPYGYGQCGDLCADFCHQYFTSICKTDTTTGWTSEQVCNTGCLTQNGADAAAGAPGNSQTSPTVLCKEYHLENAIQAGGTGGGHCDHAGATGGGGVCP